MFGMVQGLRRPGMPKSFQMSQAFAIHEVGKALVATVMRLDRERLGLKPRLERVERVSMVPRGRCGPCLTWSSWSCTAHMICYSMRHCLRRALAFHKYISIGLKLAPCHKTAPNRHVLRHLQ